MVTQDGEGRVGVMELGIFMATASSAASLAFVYA